jgi:hypothetical protein
VVDVDLAGTAVDEPDGRTGVGSGDSVPARTLQAFAICLLLRSRRRMSLRLSQPLWSVSYQACPNWARV